MNCFSDTLGLDTVSLNALDAALFSSCDPTTATGVKQSALLSALHISLVLAALVMPCSLRRASQTHTPSPYTMHSTLFCVLYVKTSGLHCSLGSTPRW